MSIERQLRAHARRADEQVAPVTLDELRAGPGRADAFVDLDVLVGAGDHATEPATIGSVDVPRRSRPVRLVAAAACLATAFATGVVVSRVTERTRMPVEQSPAEPPPTWEEPLETLPPISEPDEADDDDTGDGLLEGAVDTSIGSITWSRVDGDTTTLPARVLDHDGAVLVGEDPDPRVTWSSHDGGATWERHAAPHLRRHAGGHEWIMDDDGDAPHLLRSTADGPVETPITPAVEPPNDDWSGSVTVAFDGLPVELDGQAFVLATTHLSMRDTFLEALGDVAQSVRIESERGTSYLHVNPAATSGPFVQTTPETTLTLVERDGFAELANEDGEVLATLDPNVPGFEDRPPLETVMRGLSVNEWLVFDGERFTPLDAPWPTSGSLQPARTTDGIIVTHHDWGVGPSGRAELWSTLDGTTWERLPLADLVPDRFPDDWQLVRETPLGTLLRTRAGMPAHLLVRGLDGPGLDVVATPPSLDDVLPLGSGWIGVSNAGSPVLLVSSDGQDWQRWPLHPLDDQSTWGVRASVTLGVVDTTVYLTLTADGHLDGGSRRTLLIGEVTPPS